MSAGINFECPRRDAIYNATYGCVCESACVCCARVCVHVPKALADQVTQEEQIQLLRPWLCPRRDLGVVWWSRDPWSWEYTITHRTRAGDLICFFDLRCTPLSHAVRPKRVEIQKMWNCSTPRYKTCEAPTPNTSRSCQRARCARCQNRWILQSCLTLSNQLAPLTLHTRCTICTTQENTRIVSCIVNQWFNCTWRSWFSTAKTLQQFRCVNDKPTSAAAVERLCFRDHSLTGGGGGLLRGREVPTHTKRRICCYSGREIPTHTIGSYWRSKCLRISWHRVKTTKVVLLKREGTEEKARV